jgi:hypothetical protein
MIISPKVTEEMFQNNRIIFSKLYSIPYDIIYLIYSKYTTKMATGFTAEQSNMNFDGISFS